MFRTSNPAMTHQDAFRPAQTWGDLAARGVRVPEGSAAVARPGHMTISGTVNKSFFVLALCVAAAVVSWTVAINQEGMWPAILTFGGLIAGLISSLVWIFAPRTSPVMVPVYASFEGLFVGGISAFYAQRFAQESEVLNTALVLNAGLLSFGIFGGLLAGYATRVIRPGPWFRKAVVTAMFGVIIYGLIAFLGALLVPSMAPLASVYDPSNGGLISIGFSLFLVALASANFVLDFEFIESGVANKAPKHLEWYAAGGLLVTLVWLYLELLRLLAKIQSRD